MKLRIYNIYIPLIILLVALMSVTAWTQDDRSVGIMVNDNPYPGYNLFAPYRGYGVYLIDNNGNLLNKWMDPDKLSPGAPIYLTNKGTLMKACFTDPIYTDSPRGAGRGGLIREYDWDGNLIWQYRYASPENLQHHDFKILPNGNLLIISYEFIEMTEEEAVKKLGYTGSLSSLYADGSKVGFQSEKIIEVKPNYRRWNRDLNTLKHGEGGRIVWEWHYLDHVIQDQVPTAKNYGVVADHSELYNINIIEPRFNAMDYSAKYDQILVSNSNANEMFVIDHSTSTKEAAGHEGGRYGKGGDILYRWGNPQNYGAPGEQISGFQHTVRWIKAKPEFGYIHKREKKFHIVYFNNRGLEGGLSCVDEFAPPMKRDGNYIQPKPGEAFGPTKLTWRYDEQFLSGDIPSSGFISSAQRLPNGNTLVCSGATGTFFEVTKKGKIVWKYINPVCNNSATLPGPKTDDDYYHFYNQAPEPLIHMTFRVTRYAKRFRGFRGKDLTPKGHLEQYPDPGLAKDGDNIGIDLTVRIPESFDLKQNYPNPFNPETRIEFQLPEANYVELKIYNTLGKEIRTLAADNYEAGFHGLIWNGKDNNLQSVPTGVYIYQIRAGNFTQVKKMMLLK